MDGQAILVNVSRLEDLNGYENHNAFSTSHDTEKSNGAAHYFEELNGRRSFEVITVVWRNLTFRVHERSQKETKVLLNNLSGAATPGTLTAIMGPSGAGKTTLLNLLTGHYDKGYDGEVQINGNVRVRSLFNKQSCYVMQDDHLLPSLTVHEALTMSAQLRMPTLTKEEQMAKVEKLIKEWSLWDCQHTRTCKISGGQRKRLAIAQELVNNPPVIFLDEPTSGLDSISSLMCVSALKRLAQEGHTVICSVHSPSAKIFSYFDNLYMLSRGNCIYNGKVKDLLGFLSRFDMHCPQYHNPADYICEIAAGEYCDLTVLLAKNFTLPVLDSATKSTDGGITVYGGKVMSTQETVTASRKYAFKVDKFNQFLVLLKRCWLTLTRNQVATPLRFAAYVGFAAMMCVIFYDMGRKASTMFNNLTLIFVCSCIVIFQSLMPTLIIFPIEVSVLLREHRNCWYSLRMYYMAKYIVEIFPTVPPVLIMSAIMYYPTSQPMELWRAAAFTLFCAQLSSVIQSFGLVVSSVASVQVSVCLAFPLLSPSFMFSGYFVQSHLLSPYVRWLSYTSPIYHAYHGMVLSLYGYGRGQLDCDELICVFEDSADVLAFTDSTTKSIYTQCAILVAIEVTFRVVAFILLKWRLKRKK
ncbi:ATP-binding cassette sub-family G member 4-like [Ornithodoros turicata]|uniref:ATP-binding cassette sub-family G member 4-like n=1 Tax=Ornithodoros turicata TaxID=34597 RepID=UPI0031387CA6